MQGQPAVETAYESYPEVAWSHGLEVAETQHSPDNPPPAVQAQTSQDAYYHPHPSAKDIQQQYFDNSTYAVAANETSAIAKGRPPRRKWIIGFSVLFLVLVGAVVGGAVGGTRKHKTGGEAISLQTQAPSSSIASASRTQSSQPTSTPSSASVCKSTFCQRTLSAVAWSSSSNKRMFVFGFGQDKRIYYKSGNGDTWDANWSKLSDGLFTSPPTAFSWGTDRIDVFAVGLDGSMWTIAYNGTRNPAWDASWTSLGGSFVKLPAISSWGENRYDLFGIEPAASGGNMTHKAWGGGEGWRWDPNWGTFENAYFDETPSVVSWGKDRIDMIGIGRHKILMNAWSTNGWGTWWQVGDGWFHTPVLTSRAEKLLNIWALDGSNALHHKFYNGNQNPEWNDWEALGGNFTSDVAVLVSSTNRVDIFGLDSSGNLVNQYWTSSGTNTWMKQWDSLNGTFNSAPVVTLFDGKAAIYAVGTDDEIYHHVTVCQLTDCIWQKNVTWVSLGEPKA
ncbi:uncharacterized protein BDR25DRAFT_249312 [Lindgomyces ingoldianus]|uniref:Uncharacterized protein n=1 Tax=Lindgomyces ingoldianus TaxID=673940 RepID=A0ACB6RFY3_9PLEO|nr:uncharacterized protein BDR25DRAFT_249312 [Lindgomyces ingoldianus]KAF2477381.1 hypothetical protein BDR25DRAFT_249312 [Lindgomyces ingoldianus]